jgi:hypothetical protein
VGFLATSQALVYSIQESYIVAQLRKLGLYSQVLRYFSSAIHWCLALALFGAASFFFDSGFNDVIFSVWFGVSAAAGSFQLPDH